MANEIKIPHLWVAIIYALLQIIVFVGYVLIENSMLYLIGSAVVLSVLYILIKKKYFHLHKN
jgi:hypothetical protein